MSVTLFVGLWLIISICCGSRFTGKLHPLLLHGIQMISYSLDLVRIVLDSIGTLQEVTHLDL